MNPVTKSFIIFSGSNPRAVIAFCRKLTQLKLPIIIVARTKHDFIFRTKYKKFVLSIRKNNNLDLQEIINCIDQVKVKTKINELIICPTSEYFNIFLLENIDIFSNLKCVIPLVDYSLYKNITNKQSCSKIVNSFGITIPEKINISLNLKYPFVAKPKTNIDNRKNSLYPYLIFNQIEYEIFQKNENINDYYFEEFVNGKSYYLLYYFSNNGGVYKYSQQNLAQQANGKSIILARPAKIHTEKISQHFEEILKKLGFHGLAMVDLLLKENIFYFIEINPRFWGPLQLTIDNHSLILDAFIHDYFPEIITLPLPNKIKYNKPYSYIGGFLENIIRGQKIKWYEKDRKILNIIKSLFSDIYLRKDTVGLFFFEIFFELREFIFSKISI